MKNAMRSHSGDENDLGSSSDAAIDADLGLPAPSAQTLSDHRDVHGPRQSGPEKSLHKGVRTGTGDPKRRISSCRFCPDRFALQLALLLHLGRGRFLAQRSWRQNGSVRGRGFGDFSQYDAGCAPEMATGFSSDKGVVCVKKGDVWL